MTQCASRSAPPSRTRGIVLLGLAILGLVAVVFVLRRPLLMAAPACLTGQWHGCLGTENGVLFTMLAGLPVGVLVVWVLARLRRADGVTSAWRKSLAEWG